MEMAFRRLRCTILLRIFILVLSEFSQPIASFRFRYYDKLAPDQILVKTWRNHEDHISVNLSLPVMGKHITLSLKPDSSITHSAKFAITVMNLDGTNTRIHKASDNCFVGFVEGDVGRKVNALLVKDKWFVSFEGQGGIFFTLEPELKYSILKDPDTNVYIITGVHKNDFQRLDTRQHDDIMTAEHTPEMWEGGLLKSPAKNGEQKTPLIPNKENTDTESVRTFDDHAIEEIITHDRETAMSGGHIKSNEQPSNKKKPQLDTGSSNMSCNILAITDYKTWIHLGIEDPETMASFLVFAYQRVDRMLKHGQSKDFRIARLKIEQIYIYDDYAAHFLSEKHGGVYYNVPDDIYSVNVSKILCSLRANQDYKNYCLVNLMTAYDFGGLFGGVVFPDGRPSLTSGEASKIGEQSSEESDGPRSQDHGGQASERFDGPRPQDIPRNIGVCSLLGCHQQMLPMGLITPMLTEQVRHSLYGGHAGSQSDHITCSQEEIEGSQLQSINTKLDLDLCQARDAEASKNKAPENREPSYSRSKRRNSRALKDRSGKFCGDGLLNRNFEECDPGFLGKYNPCCTETCKLRPSAKCSPAHSPCCTHNCQVQPATFRCKLEMSGNNACVMTATFCDGVDPTTCPRSRKTSNIHTFSSHSVNAEDFSRCGQGRVCSAGECLPFCEATDAGVSNESSNLEICTCNRPSPSQRSPVQETDKCSRCCTQNPIPETSCTIKRGRQPDGFPCVVGHCPEIGCIRLETRPDPPDVWDNDVNYMALSQTRPVIEDKSSTDTLTIVFRYMYWSITGGLFAGFLVSVVVINSKLCKEEETEEPRTEAPSDARPPDAGGQAQKV